MAPEAIGAGAAAAERAAASETRGAGGQSEKEELTEEATEEETEEETEEATEAEKEEEREVARASPATPTVTIGGKDDWLQGRVGSLEC